MQLLLCAPLPPYHDVFVRKRKGKREAHAKMKSEKNNRKIIIREKEGVGTVFRGYREE